MYQLYGWTATISTKQTTRTDIMVKYLVIRVWASSCGARGSEVAGCAERVFTVRSAYADSGEAA
ncbi:hypothetical protein GCM10010462_03630 [Microbacterium dextranolyticum]|uniref:Uncharacterized protein n=1 Tax=Microbacterium dextranolyticum TaxID=36806 RepID=A0A9W6HM13_9MICO|nr:hypothetical protein GCM10017591_18280 [Microbacterium dextranolyticum]